MSVEKKQYFKLNPYLEITSGINAVLTFSEGVIKVIGTEGSGKTAICNLLLDEIEKEEELEAVLFAAAPESPKEFEDTIRKDLALNKNMDFADALTEHIVSRPSHQQKLVLIFDDSENISDETFQLICQLAEIKHNMTILVSMVLCGSEKITAKLGEPDKQTLLEKIILSLQISSMDKDELKDYCRAYMARVGLGSHNLSEENYAKILESCKGYPEKIPELIYALLDEEGAGKSTDETENNEKGIISKLVELDNDPEPQVSGLSVEDREQVLIEYNDQVPWRWQSNGVAIAVVVLFLVVAYGWFAPERINPIAQVASINDLENPFSQVADDLVAEDLVLEEIEDGVVPAIEVADEIEVEAEEVEAEVEAIDAPNPVIVVIEESVAEEFEVVVPVNVVVEETVPEATTNVVNELGLTGLSEGDLADALIENGLIDPPAAEAVTNVVNNEQEVASTSSAEEPVIETEVEDEFDQEVAAIAAANSTSAASASTQIPAQTLTEEPVVVDPALLAGPQSFINKWVSSWEEQNLDQYFDSYQEKFVPIYHNSVSTWRGDRQLKISRPNFIEIDVEDMELVSSGGAGLTVRFWLSYVSSYYKDRTLKEVLLTENSLGEFLIMQERNLEVEILPYYP